MTPLLLIGGGGHCRSCIDVIESAEGSEIVGVVDREGDPNVLLYKSNIKYMYKDEEA